MDWLSSNSLDITQKTLDNLWQSQRYSLENIANVDTPNYKAKYVTFEDELRASLSKNKGTDIKSLRRRSAEDAISDSDVFVHVSNAESTREDGNNVDLDSEYLEIARNQLQYQYAIRQINQEFSRLRTAIEG